MSDLQPETLECCRCKRVLPKGEFYKCSNRKRGYRYDCKECSKKYDASTKRKITRATWQKNHRDDAWREKNGDKDKARQRLRYLVRSGDIVKPSSCSNCGSECDPHGHHHDYTKPLDVVWLCEPCHQKVHSGLKELTQLRTRIDEAQAEIDRLRKLLRENADALEGMLQMADITSQPWTRTIETANKSLAAVEKELGDE